MDRLTKLLAKQGEILAKMEKLLDLAASDGDRDLTPAEKETFASLETDADKLKASIEVERRLEARKVAMARPLDPATPGAVARVEPRARLRSNKLVAFKGEGGEERAFRFGKFAMATLFEEGARDAATAWCKANGVPLVRAAQSEGVNTGGGFLVPVEFGQDIIDLREEFGTFRANLRVRPLKSDTATLPRRSGGLTAYAVGEGQQITESQKAWDQVNLTAKKWACLTRMSTELDEDAAIDIGDDLAKEMAYAFAVAEDGAGWNGDGTSTYNKILGARVKIIDGTHTKSAVAAASGHNTLAEVDATDLANVMAACPKFAERNAKWYCSMPAWALVFQRLMAAAGGTSIVDLGGRPVRAYLGYEIVIDQSLPTSSGDLAAQAAIFFGDLGMACTMGERRGFTIKRSDDRYFEFDQIGIMATERVDINVHDLGDNTNPGPLAALVMTA